MIENEQATDLLKWLDNFRTATVGGPAVVEAMTTVGVLSSGDAIEYAHGVTVSEHRGVTVVGHSGSDAVLSFHTASLEPVLTNQRF